jgi:hypothetical protein
MVYSYWNTAFEASTVFGDKRFFKDTKVADTLSARLPLASFRRSILVRYDYFTLFANVSVYIDFIFSFNEVGFTIWTR